MIYDGYDFRPILRVEKIDRPIMASVDADYDRYSGMDGGVLGSVRLEPLKIKVTVCAIRPPGGRGTEWFEGVRRELSRRLFRREPRKLVLHDAPDLYNMAVLSDDTDVDDLVTAGRCELTFLCPDPVAYGKEERREAPAGAELTVEVGGTYRTAPVIEVQTDGSAETVTVDGEGMSALGTLAGDQPLVFDCGSREVRKGAAAVKMDIMDDFAEWEPGRHTVSCDKPFSVSWRERWL